MKGVRQTSQPGVASFGPKSLWCSGTDLPTRMLPCGQVGRITHTKKDEPRLRDGAWALWRLPVPLRTCQEEALKMTCACTCRTVSAMRAAQLGLWRPYRRFFFPGVIGRPALLSAAAEQMNY